jgi:hypothetical protein
LKFADSTVNSASKKSEPVTAKSFFEVPEKNYYLRRKNAMSKKGAAKSERLLPFLLRIHVPSNYPDYFDLYEVKEQKDCCEMNIN